MAFDARGWRKLVVGKAVYYWRQPDEADASDVFVVRPEVKPFRLLRVAECRCEGTVAGIAFVRSRVVKDAIDAAALYGWPDDCPRLRLRAVTDTHYISLNPGWLSETVVALATGIDAERAFDRMPILADALEEAGCDNADVLDHCRGPGPHVRGCWVVDLLLGKK
jgi:hypothetical protein